MSVPSFTPEVISLTLLRMETEILVGDLYDPRLQKDLNIFARDGECDIFGTSQTRRTSNRHARLRARCQPSWRSRRRFSAHHHASLIGLEHGPAATIRKRRTHSDSDDRISDADRAFEINARQIFAVRLFQLNSRASRSWIASPICGLEISASETASLRPMAYAG